MVDVTVVEDVIVIVTGTGLKVVVVVTGAGQVVDVTVTVAIF